MRRAVLALALAACAPLAACGTSPCQALGERICACEPGLDTATCKTQVERLLKDAKPSDDQCNHWLDTCQAPAGTNLCEWMLTQAGKASCGLTQ